MLTMIAIHLSVCLSRIIHTCSAHESIRLESRRVSSFNGRDKKRVSRSEDSSVYCVPLCIRQKASRSWLTIECVKSSEVNANYLSISLLEVNLAVTLHAQIRRCRSSDLGVMVVMLISEMIFCSRQN